MERKYYLHLILDRHFQFYMVTNKSLIDRLILLFCPLFILIDS